MPDPGDTRTADFGFATIATGSRAYLEMAVDMVLSLRDFHDHPVCLLADRRAEEAARRDYPGIFDPVIRLTPRYRRTRTTKFALAELVPFAQTVFVDADSLVLGSLGSLINQTRVDRFFMMGSFLPAETDRRHHGIAVRALTAAFGLDSFFTCHAAAFGYQRAHARDFLAARRDIYTRGLDCRRWHRRGFVGDELAFGIAAARRGINLMATPCPVIWKEDLDRFRPGAPPAPLCHVHFRMPDDVMDWLMEGAAQRRRDAGLALRSAKAWRAKSENALGKNQAMLARRLLNSLTRPLSRAG